MDVAGSSPVSRSIFSMTCKESGQISPQSNEVSRGRSLQAPESTLLSASEGGDALGGWPHDQEHSRRPKLNPRGRRGSGMAMMIHGAAPRKGPCSICRHWFRPNPRVGSRQRAFSRPECQAARRRSRRRSGEARIRTTPPVSHPAAERAGNNRRIHCVCRRLWGNFPGISRKTSSGRKALIS
jgi:hypothetical protein